MTAYVTGNDLARAVQLRRRVESLSAGSRADVDHRIAGANPRCLRHQHGADVLHRKPSLLISGETANARHTLQAISVGQVRMLFYSGSVLFPCGKERFPLLFRKPLIQAHAHRASLQISLQNLLTGALTVTV